MITRRHVERLARERGATVNVERSGSIVSVNVDAPDGYLWQPDAVSALHESIRGRVSDIDWSYLAERITASSLELSIEE
jgi:hypothetical protein